MHATRLPEAHWLEPARLLPGVYALVGGITSLLGWLLDVPRLTDWSGDGISIQPNAAVCVACSGIALLLLAKRYVRSGVAVGLLVATIGGLTLLEWLFSADFGIDSFLTFDRQWGRWGVVAPGRMGPAGSLAWACIGLALVLTGSGDQKLRRIASALVMVTFGLGLLSTTGHLYQADVLYALPRLTIMALQTASFIAAASVGVMMLHTEFAPMRWLLASGATGAIARRSIPLVFIAPFLIGWLQLLGMRAGLYETSFGTALFVLALIGMLSLVLWRGMVVIARHEAALLAAEERMKLAIDAGGAATWDLDLRSGRNIWSESHFQLFGIPATESHETTLAVWQAAVNEEDLVALRAEWRRARAARDVFRCEYRLRRPDGSIRWARSAGRFFYDAGGRAFRFVGVLFDITDEKQVVETLQLADRRKNEFLAMLAHELRNPLAAVRNAVGFMQARRVSEQHWAVEVIDRQTQQMKRLVDDLLDVSRISHGTIELQSERIDLETIVHGAVEASRPLLDKHGHELEVLLPKAPVLLDADPARLTQVFSNLLDNSAKYTPDGGKIVLRAQRGEREVTVSVCDNGIGMPPEMLSHVFEMFTQVDRSLEQSKTGLGIGLTLVKRLVELHGGRVDARSAGPGKGSEFVVTLPTAEQMAPGESQESLVRVAWVAGKGSQLRPTA